MQFSPLIRLPLLLLGLGSLAPMGACADAALHGDAREFERRLAEHVPATLEQVRWLQQQLAHAPREVKLGLDPAQVLKRGHGQDDEGEGAQI